MSETVQGELKALIQKGLTFSDCVKAFGVDRDTNPYAKAACQVSCSEGEIEIDETTVLSEGDGGSYVQAWIWVSDETAGIRMPGDVSRDGEGAPDGEKESAEDNHLTVEALIDKYGYWGEHPDFPTEDWRYASANGDTR